MLNDGTQLQPPNYAPTWPVYPGLCEMVRVTGGALPGTSPRIYPALLQQFSPPLTLRDRVPVYVAEPNNVPLGGGIYDCRLVGSYPPDDVNARPLFYTTCCPSGSSSSAAPH